MICKMCSSAGGVNAMGDSGSATVLHQQCEGDCPCQHKVGKGHVFRIEDKAKPIQTQSP